MQLDKLKVICISNKDGNATYDIIKVGEIYDMQYVYYTDDNSKDLYICYIYKNGDVWRLPICLFELLDDFREKKINNILYN